MSRILIAGATGLVGSRALARLLADPRVEQVVAPTRRPLAGHARLRNPVIEFAAAAEEEDWWAVDGAICALGTTRARAGSAAAFRSVDLDLALAIARRVRAAGASRFALVSSLGADARSPFLYLRTKGELESAVAGLGFASLTIVRPGLLGGERAEPRAGERLAARLLAFAAPLLPARLRISPADEVAAVLAEAAIAGAPGRHVVEAGELAARAAFAPGS